MKMWQYFGLASIIFIAQVLNDVTAVILAAFSLMALIFFAFIGE